jgi:undecaprenyl-diphosphatase
MASLGFVNVPVMILNSVWNRPRPFVALGDEITLLFYRPTDPSSFPSNVAAVGFAVAASVWVVHRPLGIGMFVGAAVLAASRVYLGVSYPTGVLVGAALGITIVIGFRLVFALLEPLPALVIRLARVLCLG